MKITVDFDGVQEGKQYNFSFCLSSDGQVVVQKPFNEPKKPDEKKGPRLEDFEKPKAPSLDDFEGKGKKKPTEFKIESSLEGKLDAGKNL